MVGSTSCCDTSLRNSRSCSSTGSYLPVSESYLPAPVRFQQSTYISAVNTLLGGYAVVRRSEVQELRAALGKRLLKSSRLSAHNEVLHDHVRVLRARTPSACAETALPPSPLATPGYYPPAGIGSSRSRTQQASCTFAPSSSQSEKHVSGAMYWTRRSKRVGARGEERGRRCKREKCCARCVCEEVVDRT